MRVLWDGTRAAGGCSTLTGARGVRKRAKTLLPLHGRERPAADTGGSRAVGRAESEREKRGTSRCATDDRQWCRSGVVVNGGTGESTADRPRRAQRQSSMTYTSARL